MFSSINPHVPKQPLLRALGTNHRGKEAYWPNSDTHWEMWHKAAGQHVPELQMGMETRAETDESQSRMCDVQHTQLHTCLSNRRSDSGTCVFGP